MSATFPWFQSGTPATDEFQAAMKRYGANLEPGVALTMGWVPGKLFEKATASLPEAPTSAAVLEGLWSIQKDDLGGLSQPLTFTRGKPAAPNPICWWNLRIENGRWVSPDQFKRTCETR